MSLRTVLRRLTPPIVTDALRARALLPSWQAAKAAASSYDDNLVNGFRVERAALRPVDGSLLRGNLLCLTARAIGIPNLRVTDFGGATGELGRDFLAAFPGSRYVVVENPTLIALMGATAGGVQFSSGLPAECDIFFTSSTLQYIDAPLAALESGFRSARHAAVLARNSFCDRELIRVQRSWLFDNGTGPLPPGYSNIQISYPHRTLKEGAVLDCARAQGFRCVTGIEEQSGVFAYANMVYGRQLVFVRERPLE